MTAPLHLRVEVDHAPDPFLLRAAIAARLAGRPWSGPEAAVADRVVSALALMETETETETGDGEAGPWR